MKIYTKTGDKGQTSLIGGTRVPKHHLRIESYGTVDELNSYIGLIRDQQVSEHQQNLLKEIQDRLFTICSALASDPEKSKMKIPDLHQEDIELLEKEIDTMTRGGLLHDIGKVPDTESELPHALLGMQWAEKYGEKPDVCNAIGAHHDEIEMTTMLSPVIQVCDAISGARPGARRGTWKSTRRDRTTTRPSSRASPQAIRTDDGIGGRV